MKHLGKVFTTLAIAYPDYDLPKESIELYETLLSDLNGQSLYEATLRHIERSVFFPKIAELRKGTFEVERERRRRDALQSVREAREDALPKDQARKYLTLLKRKALEAGKAPTAVMPIRGHSKPQASQSEGSSFVVGEGMTEEEWQKRKSRLREKNLG